MEPSGYGQQTEGDGSLGYKPQINSASSSHSSSSSSSSYNLATPRESWAPAGHQQHQHMQQQNAPPAHLPYQQHIQQQQMYAPNNRRSNPATPSLLSSYATANAQPSLAPAVLQNRLVRGGPVVSQPQLMEYGQNQYRTVEDYGRPAHQDRVPYGGRGGPGGSNGGYYPPAPVAAAAAPRSQYGHGGQPLAAYGQQQLGGHPHDSIMHNYYADNSPASQQLPPVQPDFIFQVLTALECCDILPKINIF